MNAKSVLVSGGAGFIGQHLVARLIEECSRVIIVDNLSNSDVDNLTELLIDKTVIFRRIDICNINELKVIFATYDIDCVFHLAANSDIQKSKDNPSVDLLNTFQTTWNLLECCRIFEVKDFVFASSSAVYGSFAKPIKESDGPLLPESYYGAGKLAGEAFISAYSRMNKIRSIIIRFPNVVGYGLTHGVVLDFIRKLKFDSSKLNVLGDGNQRKPYIDVSDLIDAIIFIWNNSEEELSVYNVSSKDSISVRDIAKIVIDEMMLKNVTIEYGNSPSGWIGDIPNYSYDTEKLDNIGWLPKMNSTEAITLSVRNNI